MSPFSVPINPDDFAVTSLSFFTFRSFSCNKPMSSSLSSSGSSRKPFNSSSSNLQILDFCILEDIPVANQFISHSNTCILEKVREHSTDTPRHTLKHPHGRTSLRRKTEQGVSSSRFSACAGSQKKPDAFQVSSRRSNRLSRIYGSMRTLPETKEPVRCCMRS